MKRKRRLFGILLVITALIIMQLPVAEADAATSASDFKIEGNTLIKYRGDESQVTIPNTVEVISENAFEGNTDITSVVIPASVKKIEGYAFWGCENLNTVVLGKGLKEIGDYTFANCKGLTAITVPSNISGIGIYAFEDCVNLKDITIPPEVFYIHESSFDGCYKLMIHAEIGSYAYKYAEEFYERQKEMPEYEDVSDYDREEEQKEPQTPETDDASDKMLGSTHVVGNQAVVFVDNTKLHVLDGRTDMEELGSAVQDEQNVVAGKLHKYTIVDGRTVADHAYYKNKELQAVTLNDGIQEIGQFSFARSSITEIVLPEGTENIGYGAFYHCDDLEKVTLPDSIINVEPKAFQYTAWMNAFLENGTEDFLISGGVLLAYGGNAQHVIVPEGVRVIAAEAFAGNREIGEVSLPDSLVTIGEEAFAHCINLKNVYLGDGVRYIKDRAFGDCGITRVIFPASLESMGLKAFDEAVQLEYSSGRLPLISHELSAERLSNGEYRSYEDNIGTPEVTVKGVDNAHAHLEGGDRAYTLTLVRNSSSDSMNAAYFRALQEESPADMVVYDMLLTDASNIPLTKLGRQSLEVAIPVPTELADSNLKLYTMDRNGQLEELEVERVKLDGVNCFRFTVNYLSAIGVLGNGTAFDASTVLEETTSIVKLSAGPAVSEVGVFSLTLDRLRYIQWMISGIILLTGLTCIFYKRA